MATIEAIITFTVGARGDGFSSEDITSTPRYITLVEVREVLDIRLVDIIGGL